MAVSFEIRDGRLHISGYVNAVERDSLPIMTARGKCVEQIRAGAFAQSMADGHEIRLRYNHKRDIGSTSDGALTLREDNIGLYAEAVTDDEEVVTLAGKGELRGWSFGFVAKDDEVEERQNNIPRRHINALELREVSILSVQPAYNGTSLEYRDADGVELRAYDVYEDESAKVEVHRVNGEIKAIVETEREHSEQPSDEGNTVTDTMKRTEVTEGGIRTETVTEEHTWQRDNAALNAQIERMKMQGILMKLRAERKEIEDRAFRSELTYRKAKMDESRAELEERYNHYHDPRTGQFASGKGGGMGLYYSMGKGRGEVVGASSPWNPPQKATALLTSGEKSDTILPTESKDYGDCSGAIRICQKTHVDNNPVNPLESEITEQDIINRIGGADKTKGSCASLAFAYAANKAGYDVLDYRGGDSLEVFSNRDTFAKLAKADNSKWIQNYASSGSDKMKFIKSLPDNKEYIFSTGKHSAIVKQVNGVAYYLELQDGQKNNGWVKMRNSFDMSSRFGDISSSGYFAISVEDISKSNGFKDMCGYINTSPDKQMKGKGGYAK